MKTYKNFQIFCFLMMEVHSKNARGLRKAQRKSDSPLNIELSCISVQNGRQRKGEGWDASCLSSRPITHSISYPFTLRTRYRKEISTEVPFIVPTSYSEYTAFLKTKSKILRCVVRIQLSYHLCAVHCLNILFAAINIHLFIFTDEDDSFNAYSFKSRKYLGF